MDLEYLALGFLAGNDPANISFFDLIANRNAAITACRI